MARRPYDPLDFVPSPEIVRKKLMETLALAERLRILLELAERLRLPVTTTDHLPATPGSDIQLTRIRKDSGPGTI